MKLYKKILTRLGISLIFVSGSCFEEGIDDLEFELVDEQLNLDFNWKVHIYGINGKNDKEPVILGAEHIRVVSDDGAMYCIFRPADHSGYAHTPSKVWSPNGKYLIFSDGQHNGFLAFRASGLPATVRSSPYLKIQVVWNEGYKPIHYFDKWVSDDSFVFSTHSEGVVESYRCDLSTREILPDD